MGRCHHWYSLMVYDLFIDVKNWEQIIMMIELELTLDQFRELKYLVESQLDKDSNLVKYNEDEDLINALLELREKLRKPIVKAD
jgi:hypothetical protein